MLRCAGRVRIAIVSDIHANLWALEAVLSDAGTRGVEAILNLGDILYGPLRPRDTYDRLARAGVAVTIRGNQDRQIYDATTAECFANSTLQYAIDDLGAEPIEWMHRLPATAEFSSDIFLCHGTPTSDCVYLLEDVTTGSPRLRSDAEILRLLGGVDHPV